MNDVIINIPRSTKNAKVSMADAYSPDTYKSDNVAFKNFDTENISKKRAFVLANQRRKSSAKKVIFTEKFVISNTNQPVQISLKKISGPALSIEDAKIEIQKAYDNGFSDGQEASNIAYQNDLDKYKEWIKRIDLITSELRKEFSKQIENLEKSLIPTSIMIAKHIIMDEISSNADIVINQARKALKLVEEDEIFRISVNPHDIEILKEAKSTLMNDKSRLNKIEITGDDNIMQGGCILSTSSGIIDASIDAQLKKIKESLTDYD
jgi:flagellar assembly protein FliH